MENIKSTQSYYEGEDWCVCGACGNLIKNYRMETLSPDQVERFKRAADLPEDREVMPTGGPFCMDVIDCASRDEWRMRRQQ